MKQQKGKRSGTERFPSLLNDSFFERLKLHINFNKIKDIINNTKGVRRTALQVIPEWMADLEDEDVTFVKKFLLASGSLKEMARQYGVTYPTVRLRLDRLIQKIKLSEDTEKEPYIALIKQLTLNDKLDFETAKLLIAEYKKAKGGT